MNRLNLSIYSAIQIFVLCVVVSNSQAALYKWVDADGNTHYTQSPPTGGIEADVIKPPPKIDTNKALDQLDEQQKYLDGLQEERGKQAKKQQNEEANEAIRKYNCDLGKDKLTHLTAIWQDLADLGQSLGKCLRFDNAPFLEKIAKIRKFCIEKIFDALVLLPEILNSI